jgi:prepilin-type N-terminal cleavage/methylation domain-containing protein
MFDNVKKCYWGGVNPARSNAFTLAEVLITLGIIGVVAALTLPSVIQNYKKSVVETRLKHSYSLLNQVVKLAQAEYGDLENWDFDNDEYFINTYIKPYMKSELTNTTKSNSILHGDYHTLTLSNGTSWQIRRNIENYSRIYCSDGIINYYLVQVDINGNTKPNTRGKDKFNFYIMPRKNCTSTGLYNSGGDDVAWHIQKGGVYYDGYEVPEARLKSSTYRSCGQKASDNDNLNSYCIALIVLNGFKIPNDYPIKL